MPPLRRCQPRPPRQPLRPLLPLQPLLHLPPLLLAALLVLVPAAAAQPDHDHSDHSHALPEKLGSVHFPTSCADAVQPAFERGVALLHSFGYDQAATAFAAVAAQDPGCAMAQWGVAMSKFHVIWGPPTAAEFAAGRAAAQKAAAIPAGSERERDYVAAINTFYQGDGVAHPARVLAFEQAMAGVAERHPQDHEAAIFHALALLGVAYNSPPDKTYARQKQAAEILDRILPLAPEHPGIAHYVIHSFDYPGLAELALPAARAYARIAPSSPHALHMPSHIFTRLGLWQESIDSNLASEKAAAQWVARTHPGATAFDGLHAMDYLEYAYLQTGRDAEAREVAQAAARVTVLDAPSFAAGYALAAIPARFALERRAWKEAAALAVSPPSFPWDRVPYAEAIVHFARAVGAARSKDVVTARAAVARLAAIQGSLQGQKGFDWATQVEIQRRAAAGWLARAEGNDDQAVTLLRSAADLEDTSDKHPVTPGAVLPAREQLADLLADMGRPAAALAEYEASLRMAPARFRSLWGAAQAAEQAGNAAGARTWYAKLVELCGGGESARPELAQARARASQPPG
jgi:tetratricopeptide (TPR) repeat protein